MARAIASQLRHGRLAAGLRTALERANVAVPASNPRLPPKFHLYVAFPSLPALQFLALLAVLAVPAVSAITPLKAFANHAHCDERAAP